MEVSIRNSEVEMSLQSCPELGKGGQEFLTNRDPSLDAGRPEKGACP